MLSRSLQQFTSYRAPVLNVRRLFAALLGALVAVLAGGWMWIGVAAAQATVGSASTAPGVSTPTTTSTSTSTTLPDVAEAAAEAERLGPLEIKVSVYIMALGKPDVGSGIYTADLYVVMRCNRECDPSGFEVVNGKVTFLDKQDESPTMRVFRMNANLSAKLELHRYPFDRHLLTIELEDRLRPTSQLRYIADDTSDGFDPSVQVPGWQLRKETAHARIAVHHYPVFDAPYDDYSKYVYEVEIGRAPLAAFMKVLFPALAIMTTAFLGLFLLPEKAVQRLGIHTGALTASILFHLNVTSSIPATGYLVDADKFMLANYVGLVGAVLSTVLMMIRYDKGVEEHAMRTFRVGRILVPLAWIGAQAFVWMSR